jgi:hypothetical protein
MHRSHGCRNEHRYRIPSRSSNFCAVHRIRRASFCSWGNVPLLMNSMIGVIQVGSCYSITVDISISEMDLFFKVYTNTCFDRCAKLVDAILLSASAFLFSPLGTCLMVNLSKPWIRDLVLSRYCTMLSSLAT